MEIHFSNIYLFITFLSSFLYYGLGAQIVKTGFIPKVLAGIMIGTLPVAILVNFAAGLAHIFQIGLLILSSFLTFYYFYKNMFKGVLVNYKNTNLIVIFFIVVVGIFLTYFNSPLSTYLLSDTQNEIFHYNLHDGYFASMMLELGQASYLDRLRMLDYYPAEWSTYHFFNISALSSLSVLNNINLGIFDFYAARISFLVLFLMLVFELLIIDKSKLFNKLLVISIFSMLVTTLYYPLIHWNFFTSGATSVISLTMIFYYISKKDYSEKISTELIFWMLVFSISTIRNVPIGFIAITFYLLSNYEILKLLSFKEKIKIFTMNLLALTYIFITILTGNIQTKLIEKLNLSINYFEFSFFLLFIALLIIILVVKFKKQIVYFLMQRFILLLYIFFYAVLGTIITIDFVKDWPFAQFHTGWSSLSIFTNSFASFLNSVGYDNSIGDQRILQKDNIFSFVPWFLFLSYLTYLVYIGKNKTVFTKNKIVLLLTIFATIVLVNDFNIIQILLWLILAFIPSILLIFLSNQKNKELIFWITTTALAMLSIAPAHISYPGFQIIDIFILFVFLKKLLEYKSINNMLIILIFSVSLYLSSFPVKSFVAFLQQNNYDTTTVKIKLNQELLHKLSKENDIICDNSIKNISFRAHAMIVGKRVPFEMNSIENESKRPLDGESIEVMNTRFVPDYEIERLKDIDICKEKK